MSELRWHPLLGEWVAIASDRQDRTFLPPAGFCPLCPTTDPAAPTEIPHADFDIAVFENRFPSLQRMPPQPAVEGSDLSPVRPSQGRCEVIVYSPQHDQSLAHLPALQIERLIRVWSDRSTELNHTADIRYVFIFENRGEIVGATLSHPHGQIYAYPFIPPVIQTELRHAQAHHERTGRCIFCDLIAAERSAAKRVLSDDGRFIAFVPFFARWPYEVHVLPIRHRSDLSQLDADEVASLARALQRITAAYDALFSAPFPYVMALHQRPAEAGDYPHYHVHIEFYTPLRQADKLKFMAGSELGAGMFINDAQPEIAAARLRERVARASGA